VDNTIHLNNFIPFDGMKKMYPLYNYPYENCNYNLLLTLARYFNKSELPILNNAINIYRFDENKMETTGYFKLEVVNIKNESKLFKDLDIVINAKSPSADALQEEIIKSISNGFPIKIFIDLFYQQGRDFYYKKKHGVHPVLVCGINSSNNDIFIIDDISEYKEYCLPFSQFQDCCNSAQSIVERRKRSVIYL